VFRTDKFKVDALRLFVHFPLAEGAGRMALVPFVLRRGTRRLPESGALAASLEALYGADLHADVMKLGERQLWAFGVELPHPRYVGADGRITRQALELLRDVVFEPAREAGGGLRADYVAQEKDNLRHVIEGIVNDKGQYAMHRLVQEMFAGTAFATPRYGRIEDFADLGPDDVTRVYEEALGRGRIDLYAVGDFEPSALAAEVEAVFGPVVAGRRAVDLPPPRRPEARAGRGRTVVDRMAVNQGKLAIGLWTGVGFGDPRFAALTVANGILGGFAHSKLHRNVRERESLAYYAYSRLEGTQAAAFIAAGIEFADYERARAIIDEQIAAVQRGDVTDEEFDRTVRTLRHHIRLGEDSPVALVLGHLERSMYAMPFDADTRLRELAAVTPEAAVAAAAGLTTDTVYFLTHQESAVGAPSAAP
jgi:predicted Zn-dependent peptidase